jgi:hypothetical protein
MIATFVAFAALAFAQDAHHDAVDNRGDHVMGFSHEKTTHHFRLYKDGGAIEVTANDPKDTASRDQIQMHLSHIARMFAAGDFNAPMLIHDRVPPGVPVMQRLKAEVQYEFTKTERGGTVRITTSNAEALAAIHEFLRFQIDDHRTGDTRAATARERLHRYFTRCFLVSISRTA